MLAIRPTRRLAAVLAIAVGLALAGCSSGSTSPDGAGSTIATGTPVQVTEHEFEIVLSQDTFTAGTYTFQLTNDGTVAHNLNIKGPGIGDAASDNVMPGKNGVLTVTLQKGEYELWCSIGNHKEQGMDITIEVG